MKLRWETGMGSGKDRSLKDRVDRTRVEKTERGSRGIEIYSILQGKIPPRPSTEVSWRRVISNSTSWAVERRDGGGRRGWGAAIEEVEG
jgi:hypothetical protein